VSVEQYEALQEASGRQHAVAAALAPVRADGLEPSPEDLALFVAARTRLADPAVAAIMSLTARRHCGESGS